jgi:hypothetical protein
LYETYWVIAVVFAFSFLSNVSPFVGSSYTLFATLNLVAIGFTPLNFAIVVAVSALGATLAKIAIYYGSFGLRKYLVRNKNVQLIGRNTTSGKFFLILFATALLPVLPLDDFIYIGAGANSASVAAMGSVTFLAKVIKSGFEVALEFTVLRDLSQALGVQSLDVTILLSGAFVIIGILLYKIDWQKAIGRIRSGSERTEGEVGLDKPL